MKRLIGVIVNLIIVVSFAAAEQGVLNPDDPMRSKNFSKSFSAAASDRVNLRNTYGDILVKVWDKREVRVDVAIKVYSKDESDAQRLLDQTVIDAGKNAGEIYFKTNIGSRGGQYGSKVKNGRTVWRREVKVNYIVYMPSSNSLTLDNQYGNINMGSFSGRLVAKVQYGNFTAGSLMGAETTLDVQYGKTNVQEISKAVIKHQYGSGLVLGIVGTLDLLAQYAGVTIGTIKGNASIRQQYGPGLNLGTVDNLNLDVQYVNVKVGTIHGSANIKQQYNNITIGTVNELTFNGQYTTVQIGGLTGDGTFDMSYDRLSIDQVGLGCRNLVVSADYAQVSLGFHERYRADFDVKVTYSRFSYGDRVASRLVSDSDNTKVYSGKIGSGGTGRVVIKDVYGSVSFK